jgi:A circularly permuted ATPgrasp
VFRAVVVLFRRFRGDALTNVSSPIDLWDSLLASEDASALCARLSARMRERRLRFGDRVICPFLRPFFLDAGDESRVRGVAEMLWALGERVANQACTAAPQLLADLALSEDEIRLARIDPGYATTSTAARADAFILPDSLQFAEYNAESPAGAGYSQGLAELFDGEPLMAAFRAQFEARFARPVEALLETLVASYREWGGTATPPRMAIVDWREVPTFSEFEILRDAFTALGVPTIICDPRDLEFAAGARFSAGAGRGLYANGERIDLVYRRVLINDIVAREAECGALLDAYRSRSVCVANTLRCKIPHKKAFFAVLSDDRYAGMFSAEEQAMIRRHVPWTALVEERRVTVDGRAVDLVPHLRAQREQFVIKPNDEYGGTGVTLGWETSEADWDVAIARAIAERERGWVAQRRIAVRRELFPVCDESGVSQRDMLVDFAPYIFRGRLAGYLTRLSTSGLANVTSGGGQVPAFVISPKSEIRSEKSEVSSEVRSLK